MLKKKVMALKLLHRIYIFLSWKSLENKICVIVQHKPKMEQFTQWRKFVLRYDYEK